MKQGTGPNKFDIKQKRQPNGLPLKIVLQDYLRKPSSLIRER